jgi:hypothetical protein
MILKHELGKSVELAEPGRELPRWRYVYSGKPKPYFHPICTPAGHCLTLFEPHDHVWHRGLWYTIKFINGENFWEEHEPYGTQQTQSLSVVTEDPPVRASATVRRSPPLRVRVAGRAVWVRPGGAGQVFREERRFNYEPLDDDCYALDFSTVLTAQADLLLDRTPFTTWGGYGGLTFRGSRNWQQTRLLFSDGSTSDRPTPVIANWCDLSGKLDGGPNQTGGIALFDHPNNPRHPTPWYGATGPGHYMNAAFLFNEPMNVAEGETLLFQYRALVHDGIWEVERLQSAYEDYLGGE